MTLRKRRTPSPAFKIPPPYNPISGEQSQLMVGGLFPYCAMMQVAADDTEADYVICRGFDPRVKRYFDYVEGDADKAGIPVAKPYGSRQEGVYTVGQVFPAVLPLTKLGQNPGVAATSDGHPADLTEAVELLYTTDSKAVNWLLIDSGMPIVAIKLTSAISGGEATGVLREWDASAEGFTDVAGSVVIVDSQGIFTGGASGEYGFAIRRAGNNRVVYDLIQLGC